MRVPRANPDTEEVIDINAAADLARSLSDAMVRQLRDVIDRGPDADPDHDDMQANNALRHRGLIAYVFAEGDDRRPARVLPTRHAERVLLVRDVLKRGGDLLPPPDLTEDQGQALRSLAAHNAGNWWPGCGWVWKNRSCTVRLLRSLVRRGLATEGLTEDLEASFTITDAGRVRATPLVMRVARAMEEQRKPEAASMA